MRPSAQNRPGSISEAATMRAPSSMASSVLCRDTWLSKKVSIVACAA